MYRELSEEDNSLVDKKIEKYFKLCGIRKAIQRKAIDSDLFAGLKNKADFIISNKKKSKTVKVLKSVISEFENYGIHSV